MMSGVIRLARPKGSTAGPAVMFGGSPNTSGEGVHIETKYSDTGRPSDNFLSGTMQLKRRERGIYAADVPARSQQLRIGPGRTLSGASKHANQYPTRRLANPRFCGINSALPLLRSGLSTVADDVRRRIFRAIRPAKFAPPPRRLYPETKVAMLDAVDMFDEPSNDTAGPTVLPRARLLITVR